MNSTTAIVLVEDHGAMSGTFINDALGRMGLGKKVITIETRPCHTVTRGRAQDPGFWFKGEHHRCIHLSDAMPLVEKLSQRGRVYVIGDRDILAHHHRIAIPEAQVFAHRHHDILVGDAAGAVPSTSEACQTPKDLGAHGLRAFVGVLRDFCRVQRAPGPARGVVPWGVTSARYAPTSPRTPPSAARGLNLTIVTDRISRLEAMLALALNEPPTREALREGTLSVILPQTCDTLEMRIDVKKALQRAIGQWGQSPPTPRIFRMDVTAATKADAVIMFTQDRASRLEIWRALRDTPGKPIIHVAPRFSEGLVRALRVGTGCCLCCGPESLDKTLTPLPGRSATDRPERLNELLLSSIIVGELGRWWVRGWLREESFWLTPGHAAGRWGVAMGDCGCN